MLIDRCQFLSAEDPLNVSERTSIALNASANDVKVRNNRATRFRHFAVLAGNNNIIMGNHMFQGDSVTDGTRTGGLVLPTSNTGSSIVGNYIDNCFIEWTNERDASPDFSGGFSFSALSITDNVFLSGDVAPWFSYIVVKPHGVGHFLNGVTVTGNKFRSINGSIDRAERVDTSFAGLDFNRTKAVEYTGNTYHLVTNQSESPLRIRHEQNTPAQTWSVDPQQELPFGAWSRSVDAVTPIDGLRNGAGTVRFPGFFVNLQQGVNNDQVNVVWSEAVRGTADVIVRVDK
ncbi:MAG: hypothetical protein AAF408_08590 [Pseudomonadota bacterium]